MQRKGLNRSRLFGVLLLTVFVTACSNDEPLELIRGTYLADNLQIQYVNESIDRDESAQKELQEALKDTLALSYFTIDLPAIQYSIKGHEFVGMITPENIALSDFATLQLQPQKNGTITVISHDYDLCREAKCDVQFTLTKAKPNDPQILAIQNHLAEALKPQEETKEELPAIDIPALFEEEFWGIHHEISDDIVLKLSTIQSNGLIYGSPEHTEMEPFQLGSMTIDPQDSKVEILSFYSNAAPSSAVHQVDTISYLFILPSNKMPDLDLTTLDSENQHYFADKENLLAKDTTGFYAIQYRYLPKLKRTVIALTESRSLDDTLSHFQAINTISLSQKAENTNTVKSRDKKEQKRLEENAKETKTILLTDIKLPLKTLQSRYGISLVDLFRVEEIKENYQHELKRLLTSADLFLKEGPKTQNGYHLFKQYIGDYRFNETYLKIHGDSLKNVIEAVKSLNNPQDDQANKSENRSDEKSEDLKGLWQDPIYLYSTDPYEASGISYFKEIQPGITLEIFSPAFQGHIAEKVLFTKLLETLSWKNLPKLSKKTISNIAKYSALERSEISDFDNAPKDSTKGNDNSNTDQASKQYEFKEGKTDLQGELIKTKN